MNDSAASTPTSIDPLFDISDKVAIVTGASSGLGRQFATALARRGAYVVAVARRSDPLKALADEHPGRILAVSADVTKDDQVQDVVDRAVEWRGAIDIVVNNAGITSIQPAEDEDAATFSRVVDVNLVALYRLCHLAGRRMLEQGQGTIINIASINGLVASWSIPEAGYCASKGAVISLTRELAAQWADRGVRVNALAPGYFRSELTEELFTSSAGERRFRRMPMRRGGREDELNGALVFLASNASSYMTGQTLVIDGGWTSV
ncbi:SDR family NAD(P)-dependent oxidoreductase [Geodermatophilus sabuli]|uniref:NAD(P)-dependent dehydrogenase, short-chain alcohol dehydrogenase family n=1 Tax=Geodermatophilus sabuli TaxID=1564158 RepID=A0A285E968_9ACTN|nr:glucose 1-dehydrogenase [Geodermatophilus sabuli]MBB3082519.1 NAD(P)-dependent dehydrogenase (short-subunit alcohol dehydrogenase family) [Geodermatophilus sabuli]SNX94611.1 NAD(P)-dependent dehydrogenase, short-chain alcohol dehydrogenase family [Geodermatophilus sabuli]